MNWWEVVVPLATGIVGAVAGFVVAPWLRGAPPAPRSTWKDIDEKIDAERKR